MSAEYDRAERVRRARQLNDESVDDLRRRLLRGAPGAAQREGTTQTDGTTPTLAALGYGGHKVSPEFRSGVEALGSHLDSAIEAASVGEHSATRRHLKKAKAIHRTLADLIGGAE